MAVILSTIGLSLVTLGAVTTGPIMILPLLLAVLLAIIVLAEDFRSHGTAIRAAERTQTPPDNERYSYRRNI